MTVQFKRELTIGWLYPSLMSTYGDRGNVICLKRRCEWRGISVRLLRLNQHATAKEFRSVDLFVGGGAQDREQEIVMRDLRGAKARALHDKIEAGTPGIFTCGSPQLLGHYYEPAQGRRIEGLGVFDFVSKHPGPDARRCIGNLVFELAPKRLREELGSPAGDSLIVIGFENHGGRTYLGEVEPLGRVIRGFGNNGQDKTEGAFYRNAIATYSHGPLLTKNPFIGDWLIRTAVRVKYEDDPLLTPVDDSMAEAARRVILNRLRVKSPVETTGGFPPSSKPELQGPSAEPHHPQRDLI